MDGQIDQQPDLRLHRKRFSRMGWALAALLGVPLLLQLAPMVIMALMNSYWLNDLWVGMMLSTVSLYLVGYPLAWFLLRRLPEGERQGEGLPRGDLVRALFIALAALYLTNYLTLIVTNIIGSLRGTPVINPVESLQDYPLPYTLLVSCVLAPVAEEGLFRGLLLDRLRPYGERFAVLASALAFAMMHGNLSQMLYAFTVGVVFGYVAVRTGRVGVTIVFHAIVNFIGGCLFPILERIFPAGPARDLVVTAMGVAVLCSVVLGVILFLGCRRRLWLDAGDETFSEGRKWALFFANPGMVAYTLLVLVCVGIFLGMR